MKEATSDTLLTEALARAPSGRNKAALWLAQQSHWNGYPEPDAEALMIRFVDAVGGGHGKDAFTVREALATLKAEYRRPTHGREPWTSGTSGGGDRRIQKARLVFPTAPPKKRDPEPDPDSVRGLRAQLRHIEPLTGTPAEVYLNGRGISSSLALAVKCKYSPTWGVCGPAAVFPIRGEDGKTCAANGRAITPDTPADRKTRTFGPKSLGTFATPGALDADPVAITEACIDALSLAEAGLPAIALCGTSGLPAWLITRLAAAIVPGRSRTVFLAFDADQPGEDAAKRIDPQLSLVRTVRVRPHTKDWNADLTTEGADALRRRFSRICDTCGTPMTDEGGGCWGCEICNYQEL